MNNTAIGFISSGFSVPQSYETDNIWHQIAVVGSGTGTAATTTFYIDGIQVGVVVGHNGGTDIFAIGGLQSSTQGFAKTMDEVYVYQSSLNAAQVNASYLNGSAAASTDPIPNSSIVTMSGTEARLISTG